MLKVILTDDESAACELLQNMLKRKFPEIEVVAICHDLPSAVVAIRKHKPDAVFMDIEMPNYSGLEIMDFIPENEMTFQIIFVTAYSEYAIKAFQLSALDYLMKPIDLEQLEKTVKKLFVLKDNKETIEQYKTLKQNIESPQVSRICIPTAEGKFFFAPEQIFLFEAQGAYTQIHTLNKKLMVGKHMKYFEDMLTHNMPFLRVHRSYIVNLQFIDRIEHGNELYLKNGMCIPVIKDRIADLEMLLTQKRK